MQVNVDIGRNRNFELRDALLIYQSGNGYQSEPGSTFATHHTVMAAKGERPELGPAQPLTRDFVRSLVHSLGGQIPIEFIPDHVIARTERALAWWTPAQRRPMFFGDTQGDLKSISGCSFPQPALVWLAVDGALMVRALRDDRRPAPKTTLFVAPYWNLYESGDVCLGSMRAPQVSMIASIPQWERSFYESEFTHGNVGRVTRHPGGFEGLWKDLAGKDEFPVDSLIELPQTVEAFLKGKERRYA